MVAVALTHGTVPPLSPSRDLCARLLATIVAQQEQPNKGLLGHTRPVSLPRFVTHFRPQDAGLRANHNSKIETSGEVKSTPTSKAEVESEVVDMEEVDTADKSTKEPKVIAGPPPGEETENVPC